MKAALRSMAARLRSFLRAPAKGAFRHPGVLSLLADPSVVAALDELARNDPTAYTRPALETLFHRTGAASPETLIQECREANLLQSVGPRVGISPYGRRALILVDALQGADLNATIRKLRRTSGARETYELVHEGMTKQFFASLIDHPSVGTLYICSPWINPSDREAAILRHAVLENQRQGHRVEVMVVTRPPDERPDGTTDGLKCLEDVGAQIYFHSRLHSKLYIREPGINGGTLMAIVGSQNLTRSNYLELGIRINNDSQMINELIRYFMKILSIPTEQ